MVVEFYLATLILCRFGPAEQAINAIYLLSEHPDQICTAIVKELSTSLFPPNHNSSEPSVQGEDVVSSSMLNRFLFVVGHVALKQLVHIEEIQAELRRRRVAAKEEGDKSPKGKKKGVEVDNIEQELGTEAAAAETEVCGGNLTITKYGESNLTLTVVFRVT